MADRASVSVADVEAAAESLRGLPWPRNAVYGVQVRGEWLPMRSLAVRATNGADVSSDQARRLFDRLGLRTARFEVAPGRSASTVTGMAEQLTTTSKTPSDEELRAYEDQWVAMADNVIEGHSANLTELVEDLKARGIRHDRLFFVPDAERRKELLAAYG